MRIIFSLFILLSVGCKSTKYLQESDVQLAKPILEVSDVFFEKETTIEFEQLDPNVQIQYQLSGEELMIYSSPLTLDYSSTIVARSIREGYKSSEEIMIDVIKMSSKKVDNITSVRSPSPKYDNGGITSIIDRKKGGPDFNLGWLGYAGGTVSYELSFKKRRVNTIVISTLRNQGAWIFQPAIIKVYKGDQLLNEVKTENPSDKAGNKSIFTDIELNREEAAQLRIEIISLESIPEWHPGAGNEPWLFIDEILIY